MPRNDFSQRLTVYYDDPDCEPDAVVSCMRDFARWEAEDRGPFADKPVTLMRYLAWSALRREAENPAQFPTFKQWDDKVDYIETEDVDAGPFPKDQSVGN